MNNAPNPTVLALLNTKVAQLKNDPNNVPLRTSILKTQVDLTAAQLQSTTTEAANVVRSYTAAYAYSKGADPKAILDALSVEEQKILNYSKENPTLYGMDLITANQLAGYLGLGSGILLSAAIVAFTVALFVVGPEAAAAITAGEGLVATIGLALGSPIIATGGFLFLLSQFLGHLSSGIPMMTKQMIDNGSIGPGLRITAIKQATEVAGKLSGHLAPGPFSETQFTAYAASLEAARISGIIDPNTGVQGPYSRDALANVVLYIYGTNAGKGVKLTYTKIIPLIARYIVTGGATAQASSVPSPTYVAPSPSTGTTKPAPVQIKIYTGVVSSGTLGLPQEFVARQDDMIDSVAELTAAAKNNLAAFIAALPGKFYYEVSIVPTVKTKAETTIKGGAVQIVSGYTTKGAPKYKTVYNKFAVLKLGVLDANGKSVTLGTITLGPVNASQFNPTPDDLAGVNSNIKTDTFTTDLSSVQTVIAPQGISVATTPPPNPNPPTGLLASATLNTSSAASGGTSKFIASNVTFSIPSGGQIFIQQNPHNITPIVYGRSGNVVRLFDLSSLVPLTQRGGQGYYTDISGVERPVTNIGQVWDDGIARFEAKTGLIYYDLPQQNPADLYSAFKIGPYSSLPDQLTGFSGTDPFGQFIAFLGALLPGGNIDISGNGAGTNGAAASTTTLKDYYAALGKPLPSVEDRGLLYESYGLGAASTYTGTTEQNNRLLAFLKTN